MRPVGKVSIIVPVYNVEHYVEDCLKSIVRQDYDDIEVIIVDDGSTDGSGEICRRFAAAHQNVWYFWQENGGLSSARNAGLAMVTGQYVSFVDSDDWLDQGMISRCMEEIERNGADACGAAMTLVYGETEFPVRAWCQGKQVYSRREALSRYLFNSDLSVCVCGKVWKKELWDGVRCPEGRLHEDQFTTYRLLMKSERVCFIPEGLYFYRQRSDSIGHLGFSDGTYDLYEGVKEQYAVISAAHPEVDSGIAAACAFWRVVFVNHMVRSGYFDRVAVRECQSFCRKHWLDVWRSECLSLLRKVQISLFAGSFLAYRMLFGIVAAAPAGRLLRSRT